MLTAAQDVAEKRVAWAMLIGCPLSFMFISVFSFLGVAPGIEAGHQPIYLIATCIAWAIVSMFLPILRLLRLVSLPSAFLFVVYANMYFYVISLNIGLYLNVSWWGDMGHVISSTIVTTIVFLALCIMEVHSPAHVTFGRRGGMAAMLFFVALSFGGIWEMMEGFADFAGGGSYMVYGASDTMGDLTADLIGVVIVTVCAYWYLGRRTSADICSSIRFGRGSFVVREDGERCPHGHTGRWCGAHQDGHGRPVPRGMHRVSRCRPRPRDRDGGYAGPLLEERRAAVRRHRTRH